AGPVGFDVIAADKDAAVTAGRVDHIADIAISADRTAPDDDVATRARINAVTKISIGCDIPWRTRKTVMDEHRPIFAVCMNAVAMIPARRDGRRIRDDVAANR